MPQYMQQTWWPTVATLHAGLRVFAVSLNTHHVCSRIIWLFFANNVSKIEYKRILQPVGIHPWAKFVVHDKVSYANFSWVISVGIDTKHCYNMNPLTKHLPILKSFCGFLISQEMCKVNIPNKMQCSLGAQCHRGRLFNPEEITVLEHNHTLLKLNIELVGIYLTLMFKFGLQQNKNDWILYSVTNTTYFHITRLPVVLWLQFRICKLLKSYVWHAVLFHNNL